MFVENKKVRTCFKDNDKILLPFTVKPNCMQAVTLKNNYGLENVTIEEQTIPTINEDEVLVKVQSISLNQLDLMIVKGAFGTKLPHILGSDAAGIIEKTGRNISLLKVGDMVSSHFIQSWQTGKLKPSDLKSRLGTEVAGVFSEYIALPQNSLIINPSNLTVDEASTLPIAGLTAWESLLHAGKLKPGQTLLLQGTGGVSIFALQFAKTMGAKVIILSGSDEKLQKAKLLGADETINYKTYPNWQEKILEWTNGQGVDLALEISWAEIGKTIEAMKLGGKIVVVGLMGGAYTNLSVFGIMQKNISIIGTQVGSKSSFEDMNRAIEINAIKPVIDKVFQVSEFREALSYFEKGNHFGKVVLKF